MCLKAHKNVRHQSADASSPILENVVKKYDIDTNTLNNVYCN